MKSKEVYREYIFSLIEARVTTSIPTILDFIFQSPYSRFNDEIIAILPKFGDSILVYLNKLLKSDRLLEKYKFQYEGELKLSEQDWIELIKSYQFLRLYKTVNKRNLKINNFEKELRVHCLSICKNVQTILQYDRFYVLLRTFEYNNTIQLNLLQNIGGIPEEMSGLRVIYDINNHSFLINNNHIRDYHEINKFAFQLNKNGEIIDPPEEIIEITEVIIKFSELAFTNYKRVAKQSNFYNFSHFKIPYFYLIFSEWFVYPFMRSNHFRIPELVYLRNKYLTLKYKFSKNNKKLKTINFILNWGLFTLELLILLLPSITGLAIDLINDLTYRQKEKMKYREYEDKINNYVLQLQSLIKRHKEILGHDQYSFEDSKLPLNLLINLQDNYISKTYFRLEEIFDNLNCAYHISQIKSIIGELHQFNIIVNILKGIGSKKSLIILLEQYDNSTFEQTSNKDLIISLSLASMLNDDILEFELRKITPQKVPKILINIGLDNDSYFTTIEKENNEHFLKMEQKIRDDIGMAMDVMFDDAVNSTKINNYLIKQVSKCSKKIILPILSKIITKRVPLISNEKIVLSSIIRQLNIISNPTFFENLEQSNKFFINKNENSILRKLIFYST